MKIGDEGYRNSITQMHPTVKCWKKSRSSNVCVVSRSYDREVYKKYIAPGPGSYWAPGGFSRHTKVFCNQA